MLRVANEQTSKQQLIATPENFFESGQTDNFFIVFVVRSSRWQYHWTRATHTHVPLTFPCLFLSFEQHLSRSCSYSSFLFFWPLFESIIIILFHFVFIPCDFIYAQRFAHGEIFVCNGLSVLPPALRLASTHTHSHTAHSSTHMKTRL